MSPMDIEGTGCDCNDCGETMYEESIEKLTDAIESKSYEYVNEHCFDAIMHCMRLGETVTMQYDESMESVIFNRIKNIDEVRLEEVKLRKGETTK